MGDQRASSPRSVTASHACALTGACYWPSLLRATQDETPEERRARKKAIKEVRRERREAKKASKTAFKKEEQRQLKVRYNAKHSEGMKVVA